MVQNVREELIKSPVGSINLESILDLPSDAKAIIIFAHGTGSSRLSPRNRQVATFLNRQGFATLLFDLLTEQEDADYANRFDIGLLAVRLKAVTEWIQKSSQIKNLLIGYFGASTGAAAAIIAAAELPGSIKAVVSRGGRPDLADAALEKISSPLLLIVGGDDKEVISLNEIAANKVSAEKKISIIPGATHLFEEPGTLEQVATQAADWFKRYLI